MKDTGLDQWLDVARTDIAQRTPDLHAEQRLLARWREAIALRSVAIARVAALPARPPMQRPWLLRRPLWFGIPLAVSVCVAILVGTLALLPAAEPQAFEVRATPFIALAPIDEIERAGAPLLFSSQVPRVTLADYGLPVDPSRADQPVDAEFLMSRAGVVLAVRFKE